MNMSKIKTRSLEKRRKEIAMGAKRHTPVSQHSGTSAGGYKFKASLG